MYNILFLVEVKCGATSMDAVVKVATPYRGRVYAAGHPYDCYSVSVSDDGYVTLSMPLHGRQCGTKNMVSIANMRCSIKYIFNN